MNKLFVVKLHSQDGGDCWFCESNPGGTFKIGDTKLFDSALAAKHSVAKLKKQFPDKKFWVESVETTKT